LMGVIKCHSHDVVPRRIADEGPSIAALCSVRSRVARETQLSYLILSTYRRARPICVRHPGTLLAADTGHAQAEALSPRTRRVVVSCAAHSAYVTNDHLVAARPSVAEGVLGGQKQQNRPGRFEGFGEPGPFAGLGCCEPGHFILHAVCPTVSNTRPPMGCYSSSRRHMVGRRSRPARVVSMRVNG
jgi:hypothetical protein